MRQVFQSFPAAGTEEGTRGATVLVPVTESACQVKYVGPVCCLLCPAQTGQEFQGRQHSWSPQLREPPPTPPCTMQVSFPKSLWAIPPFPLPSSHSRLIPLLLRQSAQVPAPPKICALRSALLPAPGTPGPHLPLGALTTVTHLPGRLTSQERVVGTAGRLHPFFPAASAGTPELRRSSAELNSAKHQGAKS